MLATLAALLLFRVPETRQAAPEGTDAAPPLHRAVIRPGLLCSRASRSPGFLALVETGTRPTSASRAGASSCWFTGAIVVGCRIVFAEFRTTCHR